MNRRTFLASAAAALSMGLLGHAPTGGRSALDVAIWLSDGAAEYADLGVHVTAILKPALEAAGIDARFRVGPRPIPLPVESGRWLLAYRWPELVTAGSFGLGPVRPTGEVNVLVTDGDPTTRPAGYGMRGIAAVTGARYLPELPKAAVVDGLADRSVPAAIAQLLLHEIGHAIGLQHAHGGVTVTEEEVIASPMIGGYAWADPATRRRRPGREPLERVDVIDGRHDRRQKLGLRYSEGARRAAR